LGRLHDHHETRPLTCPYSPWDHHAGIKGAAHQHPQPPTTKPPRLPGKLTPSTLELLQSDDVHTPSLSQRPSAIRSRNCPYRRLRC
jgi:hypothetical protein